jgi:MFS family permease
MAIHEETERKSPRVRSGRLGALFLTVFLDLLGFGLVMPLLPRYAETLHASSLHIGLLGASYSAMQFLFVPVWGRLSDRVGRRPVLIGSILATIGSMLLLGFAGSLFWLFAARVFGGIATANIATAQAYIADSTTPEARARGMGLLGVAFGLGFVLGPFFGGLLSSISLGTPARMAAGLGVVNLVWVARALPESLHPEVRERNARNASSTRPKVRLGLDGAAFMRAIGTPGLAAVIVLYFTCTISFANLEQTFSLYAHDAFSLDTKHTGYVLGVVGVVAMIVQGGLIGPLNRAYGEIALVRVGTFLQATGFAIVAYSAGHGLAWLYVGVVTLSAGNGVTTPSLSTLASKRSPAEAQGASLGVMQAMGALGRVFGPTWGGFVYGVGYRLPYVTAALGLSAAFGVATLALRSAPRVSR